MAVYSTNQVRQFYVANALSATSHKSTVTNASNAGAIGVGHAGEGNDKEVYFIVKGADTVLKSDRIKLKNLDYVKAIKASDMAKPLKKVKVTLSSSINSGKPIAGQDYVLRITFFNWIGLGDANTYVKDAAVHATAAMESDKKEFYKAMVNSLNLAFSRELGSTKTSNPYLTFSAGTSGSEDGIYIEEKAQPWTLGVEEQERVNFEVQPTLIYDGGDDVIWAAQDATTGYYYTDLTASNTNKILNGKKIADMEYFYMGERGDQYRKMGWPNDIPTTYLVDATKEYSVIELHYAFTDTGVNSYRTEKDLTIVVPNGASGHVYDVINALIDEIEYHTGLTIAGLADS